MLILFIYYVYINYYVLNHCIFLLIKSLFISLLIFINDYQILCIQVHTITFLIVNHP